MNKLLLTLSLFFAHAGSLHGMVAEKNLSPITLLQKYQYFSHVLCSDIAQRIVSIQLSNDFAELDVRKNISNDVAMIYIEKLIASYEYVSTKTLCEYFFKRAKISISDNGKNRSCFYFSRDPKVFKILIEIAGDNASKLFTTHDYSGFTALHWHARENNAKVVELILNTIGKKTYDVLTKQSHRGHETALHSTACYKDIQTAELLLSAAGDKAYDLLVMTNEHNHTAFHDAIYTNNLPFVQVALDAIGEKKYDLVFDESHSILHDAVCHRNIEIIKLLLKFAGDKAQDLILMQDSRSDFTDNPIEYTPFAEATPEIREILKTYMKPDKVLHTLSQLKKLEKDRLERLKKSHMYNPEKSFKNHKKSNCLIS